MGKVYFGIPPELALNLRDYAGIDTFVETGTYKCKTTLWASGNFKRVFTIEAFPKYYQNAIDNHKESNITFLFGDTRERLPEVLKQLDKPALFWLDAHWCGNVELSRGTKWECPLMEELDALGTCGVRHYILIDDLHCFLGDFNQGADPSCWPNIQQVKDKILSYFPDYFILLQDDVIIAVPPEARNAATRHKAEDKIIVAASNKYVHVLPSFAYLFHKYYGDQPVKILRYDVRPPKLPPNFSNNAIGNQADYTWSSGIRAWLENYGPDQFIFLLDDYFLSGRVDLERLEKLWAAMLVNKDVAKIDLSGDLAKREHGDPYNLNGVQVVNTASDAHYQTSIQAAIWRKDFMLRYLNNKENPWQFERNGGRRVIYDREHGEFSGVVCGVTEPVMSYVNAVGGEGRNPGEYDHKKIPTWMWDELKRNGLV